MKRVLPTIVISQFFCTSLWFAGNAVMGDIAKEFHLGSSYLANLASAVQIGFISGTLLFAIFGISDRYSPSKVFFGCATIAALINLGVSWTGNTGTSLMLLRALTGFCLAGIYPVGMKIASDHYQQGLGKSLGFLVGALVLGTSFPHFLKNFMSGMPWRSVIFATSTLSALGGLAMLLLVPDGPGRQPGRRIKLSGFMSGFRHPEFRAAAFGYFGHMWELYAFWVFVPVMLTAYNTHYPTVNLNVPLWSFMIIAIGSLACVASGYISQKLGAKFVATAALTASCICCLISPLLLLNGSLSLFLAFLFIWSVVVIADSPLFSTLVAQNAPAETKGTSLTIVNCIGFAITIISLQLISLLRTDANVGYVYLILAVGPVFGLVALVRTGIRRI